MRRWFVYAQVVCKYSRGTSELTIPKGVDFVVVDMYGASGGDGTSKDWGGTVPGGKGGHLEASLAVAPGEKLQINVGLAGSKMGGGENGGAAGATAWAGGGGGASDIRTGLFTVEDRVLVVGAGGGGGSYFSVNQDEGGAGGAGGAGGGAGDGGNGSSNLNLPTGGEGHFEGYGGRADAGGEGGLLQELGRHGYVPVPSYVPYSGSFREGGWGSSYAGRHGGGGGGWYGGGGGTGTAGGGGGSGHADASARVSKSEPGVRSGDGEVTITYWKNR